MLDGRWKGVVECSALLTLSAVAKGRPTLDSCKQHANGWTNFHHLALFAAYIGMYHCEIEEVRLHIVDSLGWNAFCWVAIECDIGDRGHHRSVSPGVVPLHAGYAKITGLLQQAKRLWRSYKERDTFIEEMQHVGYGVV